MNMRDLMIDIETMSSSSNAAMIQIAGVFFDRETGETGPEFCKNVDLQSCLDAGFEESESNRKWWATQDQEVLAAILADGEPVRRVIMEFFQFLTLCTCGINDLRVWSHATFDFVIVQNYLHALTPVYMPYRGARDIRTLVDLSGIDLNSYDWDKKTHNALDDCKFQIGYCVDALNILAGRR